MCVYLVAVTVVLLLTGIRVLLQCTITMPEVLVKAFRPPEDCAMCKDVTEVERVSKITPWQFEDRYV